jgi:allantoinase
VNTEFRRLDHPYGMEHSRAQPPFWRAEQSLALSVVLWLDYYDDDPREQQQVSRWLGGGPGVRPYPDYAKFAHREYGNRVGVFRLMRILKSNGFPITIALDAMTALKYPSLIDELNGIGVEYIAHGRAATRMITSVMTREQEAEYIHDVVADLERVVGRTRGWMSPEYSESARTLELLTAAGIEYCCDWGNDDHPFRVRHPSGSTLWLIPSAIGLDDSFVLERRKVPTHAYVGMIRSSVHQLRDEARAGRRSLVLNLRPYLSGQGFRASHLDDLFSGLGDLPDVWLTSLDRIIDVLASEDGSTR